MIISHFNFGPSTGLNVFNSSLSFEWLVLFVIIGNLAGACFAINHSNVYLNLIDLI
ncbi:MAG: hypothetical protein HUJ56_02975 [Erysipelotrichaceae bacterium]|nr:hypothetical protein [Erysipelotrichaceae bacterium]